MKTKSKTCLTLFIRYLHEQTHMEIKHKLIRVVPLLNNLQLWASTQAVNEISWARSHPITAHHLNLSKKLEKKLNSLHYSAMKATAPLDKAIQASHACGITVYRPLARKCQLRCAKERTVRRRLKTFYALMTTATWLKLSSLVSVVFRAPAVSVAMS